MFICQATSANAAAPSRLMLNAFAASDSARSTAVYAAALMIADGAIDATILSIPFAVIEIQLSPPESHRGQIAHCSEITKTPCQLTIPSGNEDRSLCHLHLSVG